MQVTDEMRKGAGGGLVAEGELIEVVEISVEEVSSNQISWRGVPKARPFFKWDQLFHFPKWSSFLNLHLHNWLVELILGQKLRHGYRSQVTPMDPLRPHVVLCSE